MKSTRSLATIAVLASAFAVGCVGEPNETGPAESGDDVAEVEQALDVDGASPDGAGDEATPDRKRHDRDHWRGKRGKMKRGRHGPMGAFIGALRQLDLTDAQQAELKDLKASMRDAKKDGARGELHAAMSSAVASGNVSVAALSAELDAIEDGASERVAAMQTALNTVHATLTPEQRSELVSSITERFEAKADGKRGREGKRDRAGKLGKDGRRGDEMIRRLAGKLDLTDEQIAHAKSYEPPEHAKPDREAMRAKMKSVLDAFATDGFDAVALGIGAEMPAMARAKAEHMIGGLEHLVPVLDDTQRTELSKMIEERGKHGKFGRKGKRGKRGRFGKRGPDGERFDGGRRGLRAPR